MSRIVSQFASFAVDATGRRGLGLHVPRDGNAHCYLISSKHRPSRRRSRRFTDSPERFSTAADAFIAQTTPQIPIAT
jgi:hypothetical protein